MSAFYLSHILVTEFICPKLETNDTRVFRAALMIIL